MISAFIATAFAQNDAKAASQQWRHVADQIRLKVPKLAGIMDEAETDVLAYMSFPPAHRSYAGKLVTGLGKGGVRISDGESRSRIH